MRRPTPKTALFATPFAVLIALYQLTGISSAHEFGAGGTWPVNGGVLAPGVVVGPPVCPTGCEASMAQHPLPPVAEPAGCGTPHSHLPPCGPLNPTLSYPPDESASTPPTPPQPKTAAMAPKPTRKPVSRPVVTKKHTAQKRTRAKLVRSTPKRPTASTTRHGVRRTQSVAHHRTVRRPRPVVQRALTHATPRTPISPNPLPTPATAPTQPLMTTPPMGLHTGVNQVEVSPCQPITVPVTCP